jgi:hypothetical protein
VTGVRLRSRDGRAERPALPPTWRPISWWTPAAGDPAPQWLAALEVANGNPKVIVWTIGAAVSLGGAVYAAGLLAWWGGQALGLRILGWVLMVMPW